MEGSLGGGCGDHGDRGGVFAGVNASWGPRGWGLLLLRVVYVRAVTGVEGDVVVQQVSWGGRRGSRVINGRIVGRGSAMA